MTRRRWGPVTHKLTDLEWIVFEDVRQHRPETYAEDIVDRLHLPAGSVLDTLESLRSKGFARQFDP